MSNYLSFTNVHGADLEPMVDADPREDRPTGWLMVGRDPHQLVYADEDWRAVDETNWDAILDGLDEDDRCHAEPGDDLEEWTRAGVGDWWCGIGWQNGRRDYRSAILPMTCDTYSSNFDRVLLVREGSEAHERVLECLHALAGYPLLDDDAYSTREWQAWEQCWDDYARDDTRAAMTNNIVNAGLEMDADELWDMVDACEDWERYAHEGMADYRGLSGEYDEAGAVAGGLQYVAAVMRAWTAAVDVMTWDARVRAGILPLLFAGVDA